MGLDGVEIIMKIEESFDIVIEDSVAEKIRTPGQLIDLVLSKVGRTSHGACLTQRAFHRVRGFLVKQFGRERQQIRTDTSMISLFPCRTRKSDIRKVLEFVGVAREFKFFRPIWLKAAIFAGALLIGIVTAVLIDSHPIHSSNLVVNLTHEMPMVPGALLSALFCWLTVSATKGFRVEFSKSIVNIGDFSRWVVANAPEVVKAPPGQWSREQVSEMTRQIVVDVLGRDKDYREDADFVKDLGLS